MVLKDKITRMVCNTFYEKRIPITSGYNVQGFSLLRENVLSDIEFQLCQKITNFDMVSSIGHSSGESLTIRIFELPQAHQYKMTNARNCSQEACEEVKYKIESESYQCTESFSKPLDNNHII